MNWVQHVDPVVLANDNDHVLSDCDKLGVRHGKFSTIRQMNNKWLEPIGRAIPNMLNIHVLTINLERRDFKRLFPQTT